MSQDLTCSREELLTPRIKSLVIASLLAAVSLTGCAVGPNYKKPSVPVPPEYHGPKDDPQNRAQTQPQAKAQAQAASIADLPWWEVFQDPVLQELIRTALKRN